MLEAEFQTADTRLAPFPWGAVLLVAVLTFALGGLLTALATSGLARGAGVPGAAAAVAAGIAAAGWWLRARVERWRADYGAAVEYVARRKREQEAGLRFLAP